MKALFLLSLLACLPAFASSDDENCEATVRRASELKYANGNKKLAKTLNSSAKLLKKTKGSLHYKAEVFEQYTIDDSGSGEFPSVFYSVVAFGSEAQCEVSEVNVMKDEK